MVTRSVKQAGIGQKLGSHLGKQGPKSVARLRNCDFESERFAARFYQAARRSDRRAIWRKRLGVFSKFAGAKLQTVVFGSRNRKFGRSDADQSRVQGVSSADPRVTSRKAFVVLRCVC